MPGGSALCELVQHLAMADFVAISGQMEDRAIEFADHLHEHFVDPVRLRRGRYLAPSLPGFSAENVAAVTGPVSISGRAGLATALIVPSVTCF